MKRPHPSSDRPPSPPAIKKKLSSNTTNKAVANFFAKPSEKAPEKLRWRTINNSLLIGKYTATTTATATQDPGPEPGRRRRVAAFDFDWTLTRPSSGNVFSRTAQDWQWWSPVVPGRLKSLDAEGYAIVIISNQGVLSLTSDSKSKSLGEGKRLSDFKTKINYVLSALDLDVSIYAATLRDEYRKPRTGMWRQMLADLGEDIELEGSFFVGDAGGRLAGEGGKADHACSDRDFAANVGIGFMTPEEYFLGEEGRAWGRAVDLEAFLGEVEVGRLVFERKSDQEVVVLCGSPGAGKSTFYQNVLQPLGYKRVNQDILKTRDKCLKVAAEYLASGDSVAVDNTNADADTRHRWILLAQKHNLPIRAVHLTTPVAVCQHNDAVRAGHVSVSKKGVQEKDLTEEDLIAVFNPEKRSILPHMAFTSFVSRFVPPVVQEGFSEVITVPFVFSGSEAARKVWGRYWV